MKLARFEQLKTKIKRWLLLRLINDLYEPVLVVDVFGRNVRPYNSDLKIHEMPSRLGFGLSPAHAEFVGWMWRVLLSSYSNMGSPPKNAANVFFDPLDIHGRYYSFGIDLIGWGEESRIHAESILREANREVRSPIKRTVSLEILENATRLRVNVGSRLQ